MVVFTKGNGKLIIEMVKAFCAAHLVLYIWAGFTRGICRAKEHSNMLDFQRIELIDKPPGVETLLFREIGT